jgi:hypothetical protein
VTVSKVGRKDAHASGRCPAASKHSTCHVILPTVCWLPWTLLLRVHSGCSRGLREPSGLNTFTLTGHSACCMVAATAATAATDMVAAGADAHMVREPGGLNTLSLTGHPACLLYLVAAGAVRSMGYGRW